MLGSKKPFGIEFALQRFEARLKVPDPLGLKPLDNELVLPPSPAISMEAVYRRPVVGKIGLSIVL